MDAIHEGVVVPFALGFAEGFGHGAVGQQHEVFDEFVRFVLHTHVSVDGFLVLVEDEFHLFRVEINASQGHSLLAELGGQIVEFQDFVFVVAIAAVNHGLHFLVGVSAARLDDGLANPAVVNFGVVVHLEHRAEGEFFLVGTQRTNVVAEFFGQHGDGAVNEIDRGSSVERLLVDGRSGTDVVRHVGDVHTHFPMAVRQLLQRDGVIEVLRVGGVDGDGEHLAEVAAFLYLVLANLGGNLAGFLLYLFRELYRVFDGFHFHVVLARLAEHAGDFAEGVARAVGPIDEVGDDLVAVFGAMQAAARDEDIDRHPVHVGAHIHITPRDVEDAHEVGVAAFQNFHDFALGLRVVALGEHGHAHAVAMQRLEGVVGRDEDVVAFLVVADDVGLARRFHLHRAFHVFRLRAKLRHALRAHHITVRPLLFQQPFVFQVDEKFINHVFPRQILDSHNLADLLIVFRAERFVGENAEDDTRESAQLVFYFFLFCHSIPY